MSTSKSFPNKPFKDWTNEEVWAHCSDVDPDGPQVLCAVFILGRNTTQEGQPVTWEFQGVFSTLERAIAACRDSTYFVGPAWIDQAIPHDTQPEWPGAWYPKCGS